MFITTHAAVGAIVGETTGNPWLAIIGGFVSHLLIDIIPHGDSHMLEHYQKRRKVRTAVAYVTIDSVVAILFTVLLFQFRDFIHPANVGLGIAFGVLPDALVGLAEIYRNKWLHAFHRFHFFFHNMIINRRSDFSFRTGFAMQLVLLALLQLRVF